MKNPILAADSYKHSHYRQLPPQARFMSSYLEPRYGGVPDQITQFFGLQPFIDGLMTNPIEEDHIEEAKELLGPHGLPFNETGWRQILSDYDGYLPLRIEALPEGVVVPRGTPLLQVHNTDARFPWLTSFIETALLRAVWYPSSVASISFLMKTIIYDGLLRSSDNPEAQLPFKLHDFGARGASSAETAALGGMAHLVNFSGTDTLEAILAAKEFYYAEDGVGLSIPASEHSTMTSWGRDHEAIAYQNMIEEFGDGIFSIVSDSYDIWNAVDQIFGVELRDQILGIEGKLVVRPDSGDPVTTPLKVLQKLWDAFGGTENSKGFKVLNPKVGLIQGDGMDAMKVGHLVHAVIEAGFSIDNITFGMGGGLLQKHTRDDMRFAMKANAIDLGDGWIDVQKNPASDPLKVSKAGRQAVVLEDGVYKAVRLDQLGGRENQMRLVYHNGVMSHLQSFEDVRREAHQAMLKFHEVAYGAAA